MRTHRLAGVVLIVSLVLSGVLVQMPGTASASQAEACFAETGRCIRGRFLAYWQANGGLARNGFPLSEERRETLEDGNEYVVQYFERVRLEYHSLNPAPYDVLLGQFGRRVLRERFRDDVSRYQRTIAPVDPAAGRAYFRETGHNLGGRFLTYWEANGGLAQFGYPLTEEFGETLDDGRFYEVQYFERGRLEYHPENAGTPFEVLLGQFGRGILAQADLLAGAPSFNSLYITDQDVRERLGRPLASAVETLGAFQAFERGSMLWRGDRRWIYVLCGAEQSGQLVADPGNNPFFFDTFEEGQDPGGGSAPVAGLFLPKRGFGKVWRADQRVRDCLGYATTADETGYSLTVQDFERGVLLASPDGRSILVVSVVRPCNSCAIIGSYERHRVP